MKIEPSSRLSRVVLVASAILVATACTETRPPNRLSATEEALRQTPELSERRAELLLEMGRNAEAADVYGRLAQLSLYVQGFSRSHELLGKALLANHDDARARFWRAISSVAIQLEGFAGRVANAPALGIRRDVLQFVASARRRNLTDLVAFISRPGERELPLRTAADIQGFVREAILPALDRAVDALNKLRLDRPFVIELAAQPLCESVPNFGWTCTPVSGKALVFRLDQADLIAVTQSLAGIADVLHFNAAIGLQGLEQATRRIEALARSGQANPREITAALREQAGLLTVVDRPALAQLSKSLLETLTHLLRLEEMKGELCSEKRYRGDSVFRDLCYPADTVLETRVLATALEGGTRDLPIGRNEAGDVIFVRADLSRLLTAPPADLKSLLPAPGQFDSRGQISALGDPTLGGVFPDGDFFEKAKLLRFHLRLKEGLGKPGRVTRNLVRGYRHSIEAGAPRK